MAHLPYQLQELAPEFQVLGDQLRYLPAYQVIICKDHGAVRSWASHLKDSHKISSKKRKALDEEHNISSLQVANPRDIALPPPNQPPIQALGPPLPAFACSHLGCDYITTDRKNIRRHYNQTHNWISSPQDRQPWACIQAQTFFRTGGFQRYFQVKPIAEAEGGTTSNTTTSDISRLLHEIQSSQAKHAESLAIADATIAKTDHTGWFKRNQWPIHLARCNLRHLSQASRMPDKDDTLLNQAVNIVEQAIEQAVAGLSTLRLESRRWLRSANPEQIDVRPMARLQNSESQKRYAGYMKRFICYLLRVLDAQQAGSENSGSDSFYSQVGAESEPNSDTKSQTGPSTYRKDKMYDAKRLFPWSGNQKELTTDFVHALNLDTADAQITCLLRLFQAFIFHRTGDEPFQSGLIHFLAVLGIDETANRLREAHDFSYMLAGVVYCTRVLAVEILLPAAQRQQQGEQEREDFIKARKQYLVDGSYSPFSEMLSLLAYSKHIALNIANAPISQWSRDRNTLYIRGQPVSLTGFQAMVAGVLQQAESCLWGDLLWTQAEADRFQIPLDKIQDDVTFSQRGYSFLSRPDNELSGSLEETLTKMMGSPYGRKLRNAQNSAWQPKAARRYLRQVEKFLEFLLFLTHVTSGQPARGSEITTARHRNGYMQDRNLFVIDGQVVFISRYHKSQAMWDKPKVIPRFLPWRVGQLFAVFLAYVQPLAEHLNSERLGISPTDYIWASGAGPWETSRLSRILARETSIWLGSRFTALEYRHAAITIGREVVSKHFSEGTQEALTEGEWEEPEMQPESGLDLQAGRTELTGTLRYGVEMGIVSHLSHRSIELFQHLSSRWHSFLQLSSASPTALMLKSTTKGTALVSQEDYVQKPAKAVGLPQDSYCPAATQSVLGAERPAEISDSELQGLVRRVVQRQGPLTFKSPEQETALRAILAGETPLVVVLPTGGGKSLLFMAPACLPSPGVTIVVVPFRELIRDLKKRLAEAKIPAIEWVAGHSTNSPATVIVVSADTAGELSFLTFVTLLQEGGWLKRIVIDECHLTFTSYDWRPRLAHLSRLRSIRAQFILLTATQPPLLEFELGVVMRLQSPRYIRACTTRSNIRYLVQRCQRGRLIQEAEAIARRWLRQLSGNEKAIIYCRYRNQCDLLGGRLACPFFHAGMEPDDRSKALKTWLQSGGLIVATSSLGTGVDYPKIVRVLHAGAPYGMIDFAQESGRAGRQGELVDSVVLVEQPREAMPPVPELVDEQWRTLDESAMQQFIYAGPGACRRNVLGLFLDGRSAICAQIQAANCDLCGEGQSEWAAASREQAREEAKIREVLQELVDGCPVCWVYGLPDWAEHAHADCNWCRTHDTALASEICESIRRTLLRWTPATHTCYKCGLSQHFCATGQETAEKCQWPGIVVPMLVLIARCGGKVLERFKVQGLEKTALFAWFTQKHGQRKWGAVVSNGMAVLGAVLTQEDVLQDLRAAMRVFY
jgi:superfamily II DNA helicase RecQ